MSVLAAIRTYLVGQSAVTDRIGNRIYPLARPQRAPLPAAVYSWLGDTTVRQFDISQTLQGGLFEVDCIAESYDAAAGLAATVTDELDGYAASAIRGVFFSSSSDLYEPATDGSDRGIFRRVLTFDVWFDRAAI